MLINVKTEKRQQTLKCHPSFKLSAVQLNRVERLSVTQKKTCFNSSRGSLDIIDILQANYIEHNFNIQEDLKSCMYM